MDDNLKTDLSETITHLLAEQMKLRADIDALLFILTGLLKEVTDEARAELIERKLHHFRETRLKEVWEDSVIVQQWSEQVLKQGLGDVDGISFSS